MKTAFQDLGLRFLGSGLFKSYDRYINAGKTVAFLSPEMRHKY